MYNRRVSKCNSRVEAYGTVDELNAAIGLARASVKSTSVKEHLLNIQRSLITLMGELATAVDDLPRYVRDGFPRISQEMTAVLDAAVAEVESRSITFRGWAIPGENIGSAALDVARTVCRRAERCVCALHEAKQLENPEIIVYLNRLSDLLWLFGRWEDSHQETA